MRVLGTAGHVDHGKTSLIKALTGMNTDRLKEEQVREMTIDLGFAWMKLPNGELVGIVDVPGHRDFIENMVAGVGGIDAVLFVVAADEGVMPQTREHLNILNLLNIRNGVIVLNKTDLVREKETLTLREEEIRKITAGTFLENSPLVKVSARAREGLDVLKREIVACLKNWPNRPNRGKPRLNIDRAFTISGFGTVVTGTLLDGELSQGQELEILPLRLNGRVRGLQTHKQKEETAIPGSRVAVNISGVNIDQVGRGMVVALPGQYTSTQRVDATCTLLEPARKNLRHHDEVKFFSGTSETIARVRVLGEDEILPGGAGFLQIEFVKAVVVERGDRFILRWPSPGETLGGGIILDSHPKNRHRRYDPVLISHLKMLVAGDPESLLVETSRKIGPALVHDLIALTNFPIAEAKVFLVQLIDSGDLVALNEKYGRGLEENVVISKDNWIQLIGSTKQLIQKVHNATPLLLGIAREELKSKLGLTTSIFNACLAKWKEEGWLLESQSILSIADHKIKFNPYQQVKVDNLVHEFAAANFSPPTVKECVRLVGNEVFQALVDRGDLKVVSREIVFREEEYSKLVELVKEQLARDTSLTVQKLRNMTGSSRKYILPFLEHLDNIGMTIREGEGRRLK